MSATRKALGLAIVCGTAATVLVYAIAGRPLRKYQAILRNESQARGVLVEFHPEYHEVYVYRVNIAGQVYSDTARSGDVPSGARIGDSVTIHYATDAPWLTVVGDPSQGARNELWFVIAAVALVSSVVMAVTYRGAAEYLYRNRVVVPETEKAGTGR